MSISSAVLHNILKNYIIFTFTYKTGHETAKLLKETFVDFYRITKIKRVCNISVINDPSTDTLNIGENI